MDGAEGLGVGKDVEVCGMEGVKDMGLPPGGDLSGTRQEGGGNSDTFTSPTPSLGMEQRPHAQSPLILPVETASEPAMLSWLASPPMSWLELGTGRGSDGNRKLPCGPTMGNE